MAKTREITPKDSRVKCRIFMVEDHPIVTEGLRELIEHEQDLVICGGVQEAEKALGAISKLKPDLVLVDISLPGKSGLELIKDIKARHPQLPILVLSMHDEKVYAERALRAGAAGYVMKAEATEKVVEAIHKVLGGEVYVSDAVAATMVRKFVGLRSDAAVSPIEQLSDRELEVFQLIGHGLPSREIAKKLHLSVKTIETYRDHIKRKLGLKDATELLQYAIQWVQSQRENTAGRR